jgi:hypothetical protein
MSPAVLVPTTPVSEGPRTYAIDRAVTGIGSCRLTVSYILTAPCSHASYTYAHQLERTSFTATDILISTKAIVQTPPLEAKSSYLLNFFALRDAKLYFRAHTRSLLVRITVHVNPSCFVHVVLPFRPRVSKSFISSGFTQKF